MIAPIQVQNFSALIVAAVHCLAVQRRQRMHCQKELSVSVGLTTSTAWVELGLL